MKAKDKTIIVTGAGSGMGRELSLQLVRKGARVIMADINEAGMEETARLAGGKTIGSYKLDISDQEAVENFCNKVLKQTGSVDGLINNAGVIQPFVPVQDLSMEKITQIFQINFFGMVHMTKHFLPHLLERPEAHVMNISSMGGFIPFPGQTVYSASKAAVKVFTEGLYAELKNTRVHVTVVFPGAVNTHIMSNSGLVSREAEDAAKSKQAAMALPADKAAAIMLQGMESDAFRVLVGRDAGFLDKFYRLSPRRAIDFIVKKMSGMQQQTTPS